jgi:hypothetical protein
MFTHPDGNTPGRDCAVDGFLVDIYPFVTIFISMLPLKILMKRKKPALTIYRPKKNASSHAK